MVPNMPLSMSRVACCAAVCRAGLIVDCLQDPATCAGGIIPFTAPVAELQMQVFEDLGFEIFGFI
jgi:hypothetical protein